MIDLYIPQDSLGKLHTDIFSLAHITQDVATGVDADGQKVKNAVSRVSSMLADAELNAEDRKRLLMILAVCEGISTRAYVCNTHAHARARTHMHTCTQHRRCRVLKLTHPLFLTQS